MPEIRELKAVLFGASGMVGAAVLDSCLNDPDVVSVLSVGRRPCGRQHPKLSEIIHTNLFDISPIADKLRGYNACLFTLGVSSAGKNEADYTRLTYDLTTGIAKVLAAQNPDMAICYVSGAGTDESEKGRIMWARVKGRTENALMAMPFRAAIAIRLGGLVPLKGFASRTPLYRVLIAFTGWLLPLLHRMYPAMVTTPQILGRAMIRAAQGKAPKPRLEPADIHALGSQA